MVRVLLTPSDVVVGDRITLLDSETLHYLKKVVRVQPGEAIEVLTDRGKIYKGTITDLQECRAEIKIVREGDLRRRPPHCILAVSLLSLSRFDEVLDKSAEFGIEELVPMLCERTVVRLKPGEIKTRWIRRLSQVCRSVGTPFVPAVHPVKRFEDVLDTFSPRVTRIFIPHLRAEARHILGELLKFQSQLKEGDSILILIGPEGDFSPREVDLAQQKGALSVSLGPLVLRVETAAGLCAGLVQMVRTLEL